MAAEGNAFLVDRALRRGMLIFRGFAAIL